jgi:hypothetical protein
MTDDEVQEKHSKRDVVTYYASATELQPCELAPCERWLNLADVSANANKIREGTTIAAHTKDVARLNLHTLLQIGSPCE